MKLTIDRVLKTAAGLCALLAGTTYVGIMPPVAAVAISMFGILCGVLATSPLLDPAAAGATPLFNRVCLTLAAVSAAVAGSSYFVTVQQLVDASHPGTAHKIGVAVALVGAVFGYLSQSPLAGTAAGGGAALALLVALSFGMTGCAAVVSQLPAIVAYVQDAEIVLHTIQTVMDAIWATHPDPKNQSLVDAAIAKCLTTADAVNRLAQGGQDVNQGQVDDAFVQFEGAFNDLMSIVGPYGVSAGDVPKAMRTASGGVVVPRPLMLAKARK